MSEPSENASRQTEGFPHPGMNVPHKCIMTGTRGKTYVQLSLTTNTSADHETGI